MRLNTQEAPVREAFHLPDQENLETAGETGLRLQQGEYAGSVVNLVRWGGELAVTGLREQNFNDYSSSLREMLRTDKEFSSLLDIDDRREHPVVDGRAQAPNGQSMAEIIAEGRRSSERLAADYEEWEPQAIRDGGDEVIAARADALEPGQALFAVSLNPDQALKDYSELYRRLGYRDIAYIQYYVKTKQNTLVAGSYSVSSSHIETWRQLFAERGVEVPAEADDNTFIRYGFELTASAEEAERVAHDMRQEYYKQRGIDHKRHSVSEYLKLHNETAGTFFDTYYPSLANAANSRRNNEVMQGFARTLLDTDIARLKPEIKRTLIKVANSENFDYQSARVMDSVIRYAVVEELRKGLPAYVRGSAPAGRVAVRPEARAVVTTAMVPGVNLMLMNSMLAGNVSTGVQAGRYYGGCPGQVELGEEEDGIPDIGGTSGPQAAYGGRSRGSRTRLGSNEDCEFTSEECPECHEKKVHTKVTRLPNGGKRVTGTCGCSKTYN